MPDSAGNDIKTLRSLAPFLWDYRGRVVLALGFLVLAKVANVGIPLVLKDIVDSLDSSSNILLVLPLGLLLGYGALKLASTLFNELRDSVFARVRHGAMRQVSLKVLEHLHHLSLRFHLERKTGGLSHTGRDHHDCRHPAGALRRLVCHRHLRVGHRLYHLYHGHHRVAHEIPRRHEYL
jgi:ATP-binding cassette subfamily B protein